MVHHFVSFTVKWNRPKKKYISSKLIWCLTKTTKHTRKRDKKIIIIKDRMRRNKMCEKRGEAIYGGGRTHVLLR